MNAPPFEVPPPSYGLILAGGRSRRFGSRKALARVGGLRLIDRVIAAHRQVFTEVLVVTGDPEIEQVDGVTVIPDLEPGAGPLAGLHAGLLWGRERGAGGACCTPCDAPFVDPELFRLLLAARANHSAVLPLRDSATRLEPLFGWYSCRIVPIVEAALESRDLSLKGLARTLTNVRFLGPDELPAHLVADRLFFNVNTPADAEIARRCLEGAEA